jgi:hypothetical protein
VRRIFALCAQGYGYKRIADALNAERVPSPPPRGRGRIRAWAASTVREILHRPLYRGEVVWNQRRKRDRWGQKHVEARPASEWIRQEAPELRIVSEAEWQAARARLDGARDTYIRAQGGRIWSRGVSGIESRFLLSGFLECAHCRGTMRAESHDWKTHRRFSYVCHYNRSAGRSICANNLRAPMEATDRAILAELEAKLFAPAAVEEGIRLAVEALRPVGDALDARRVALRVELAEIAEKVRRLTEAIEDGAGEVEALVAALKARQKLIGPEVVPPELLM